MTSPNILDQQPAPLPARPPQNEPLDSYEPGVYELVVDNWEQPLSKPEEKVYRWKAHKRGDLISLDDPQEIERLWLGNAIAKPGEREQQQADAAAAFAEQAKAAAEAAQARVEAAQAELAKRNEVVAAKRGPGRPPKQQEIPAAPTAPATPATPTPAATPTPTPPPAQ